MAINREIRQREKEAKRQRHREERICAAESIHVQESEKSTCKAINELSQSEQANDDDEDAAAGAAAAATDTTPACFSEEWLRRSKRKWRMQRAIRKVRGSNACNSGRSDVTMPFAISLHLQYSLIRYLLSFASSIISSVQPHR